MSISWPFIEHNSRNLIQSTTAAKMSQKKFNESNNGFTRVINLCTFPDQPAENKQVHYGGTNLAAACNYRLLSGMILKYLNFEYVSPSSLREMSNSLWSRPKWEPALKRKSRICIISQKGDNFVKHTHIFKHLFPEIYVPFDFHPGISRIFGLKVRFSVIRQFSDFLKLFPGNFPIICLVFEHLWNFWSNGKRPSKKIPAFKC